MKEIISNTILDRLKKKNKRVSEYIDKNDINMILHELDVFESELLAQIDELENKELLLNQSKAEYENLFNNSPILYIILNSEFMIKKYNIEADKFFNFSLSKKDKLSILTYLGKNNIKKFFAFIDSKNSENDIVLEFVSSKKKNLKFKVSKYNYSHMDKDLILVSLVNVQKEYDNMQKIEDLSNEKIKNQEMILRQGRTAAIGEMLGNIAHQWRQPLSVISMVVSNLEIELSLGEKIEDKDIMECVTNVNEQVKYLSKTIDDFRNFFSSNTQRKEEVNISKALEKVHDLIESSFSNNFIQYNFLYDDKITLNINESLLIQALINIYNNAKDAIVLNDCKHKYFFVTLKEDEQNVYILLRDSGGGIKDGVKDNIFDPYFTTKHQSQGTGIGLFMTYEIISKNFYGSIEAHNCKYTINDKVLQGAEFIITIPKDKNSEDLLLV